MEQDNGNHYKSVQVKKRSTQQKARKRKGWTQEEDNLLIEYLRMQPSLCKCFVAVAKMTGRTPKSIEGRWYNHLSKTLKKNPRKSLLAKNRVSFGDKLIMLLLRLLK